MKHCLPKRFYKDICLLDFCKVKMSIREATLNLQKPCMSARIAPWFAVMRCLPTQTLNLACASAVKF
jgi:hypothetical protein